MPLVAIPSVSSSSKGDTRAASKSSSARLKLRRGNSLENDESLATVRDFSAVELVKHQHVAS
jgi:hypothetical protein